MRILRGRSAGAGDANMIPALNASGVLDLSITNGKAASAGASDAGKLVALDAAGRINTTMMPTGIGADTAIIVASEALSAGDLVNIYRACLKHIDLTHKTVKQPFQLVFWATVALNVAAVAWLFRSGFAEALLAAFAN